MSRAPLGVLATIALVLVAVAVLEWCRGEETVPAPAAAPAPAGTPAPPRTGTPAEDPAGGPAPAAPSLPPLDPTDLEDRRAAGASPGEPVERLPTRIVYPVLPKYAEQSWSRVPHEIVAAFDEREDGREGAHRLFIAVVAPERSDAELEALVRDLGIRHRDARVLRVRVFDSAAAAARPSWTDGGAARDAHLVAELHRDAHRTRLAVRGRELAR